TFARVQRIRGGDPGAGSYYIHKDLYKTLARIRAREFAKSSTGARITGSRSNSVLRGGSLNPERAALEDHSAKAQMAEKGDRVRSEYLASLIEALGLAPEPYLEIPGPAVTAAAAASEAFQQARQSNRLLDDEL